MKKKVLQAKAGRRVLAVILACMMTTALGACQSAPNSTREAETVKSAASATGSESGGSGAPSASSAQAVGSSDEAQTRVFTDSVGREVTIPREITKVAVSGPLTQITLFALCPDKLVGTSGGFQKTAAPFIDEKYRNLPDLGQLYGKKGGMNLEALLSSGAQVVIDIGEPKDSMKEDLDALQKQTGIPFVHITAELDNMGEAYRQLGDLLGMQKEADTLAAYCDQTYQRMQEVSAKVQKKKVIYLTGPDGLSVIAKGSFHAGAIDLMADNVAVLQKAGNMGTGSEVDLEQILKWNPDVIIFSTGSIYDQVGSEANWKQIPAIKENHYYEVPEGPYNWLGFPPAVQRYLGLMWMEQLLYPEEVEADLYQEAEEYFKLFYHCDLSKDRYNELMKNSLAKEKGNE